MTIGRFIGGVGAVIYRKSDGRYLILQRSPQKDFAQSIWDHCSIFNFSKQFLSVFGANCHKIQPVLGVIVILQAVGFDFVFLLLDFSFLVILR